jgi:hypothetical protein
MESLNGSLEVETANEHAKNTGFFLTRHARMLFTGLRSKWVWLNLEQCRRPGSKSCRIYPVHTKNSIGADLAA